jgi:hypothetical protein
MLHSRCLGTERLPVCIGGGKPSCCLVCSAMQHTFRQLPACFLYEPARMRMVVCMLCMHDVLYASMRDLGSADVLKEAIMPVVRQALSELSTEEAAPFWQQAHVNYGADPEKYRLGDQLARENMDRLHSSSGICFERKQALGMFGLMTS